MKKYISLFLKKQTCLFLIFLLAIILRFWQLGSIPPSLTWDEVAWGYNAYSLGTDGRDEFGKFLPIQYLESFGDFKPPVYAYLDILPVKIFGLNEFAVRFPSASLGVLTVVITYFLVRKIFPNREQLLTAQLSALFLAISPWHINLSRMAFEANVTTFLIVLGVWLFLGGVQNRRWCLPLSAASFILSMYTFNTARIVAPLLVLLLAIGLRKKLLQIKREVSLAIIVGVILMTPLLQFIFTPQAQLRFHEVNIFSDAGIIVKTNQKIANDGNAWWSRIIHNRRLAYGLEYLRHYFDHFNPNFLFIKGDGNPKFSTQDVGQLFFWDLPFLIIGILLLLRKKEGYWWIIPFWLLVAIVPAATARETPHALRIETTLPTFQILVAYGFVQAIGLISKIKYQILNIQIKYQIFLFVFLFLIFNFLYYIHGYYAHYPREFSGEWQYGYKDSIAFVQKLKDDFDQVNVTTLVGRPYIYYLFYTKTRPEEFRKTAKIWRDSYGFVHVDGFATYRFGEDLSKLDNNNKRVLYVNAAGRSPKKASIFKTVKLLNGDPVFTIYEIVYVPEEQK